jgi:hypothetical protein
MNVGRTSIVGLHYFDLNIEKVLEHWPVEFAIREVIANALDEHAIVGGEEPEINQIGPDTWAIMDHGRGLRYEHLTQKENQEKRNHPEVIGQFGMGLKDALAVFHRRGVTVEIHSRHGDITTEMRPKEGFADVITLHAAVRPSSHPNYAGTVVVLTGVSVEQVEAAKRFFLRYSQDRQLETTMYGSVLARPDNSGPARIYVKGLLVAEEENFLFSYNITDLSAALRRALNRERTNVGRTAYSDRVKAILKKCTSSAVAGPLAVAGTGHHAGRHRSRMRLPPSVLGLHPRNPAAPPGLSVVPHQLLCLSPRTQPTRPVRGIRQHRVYGAQPLPHLPTPPL